MKANRFLGYAIIMSFVLVFSFPGYGDSKTETANEARSSDEISETPSQERSEYLERLRSETSQLAQENISFGRYDEAIDIAEKAVAELEDSDVANYPGLAARLYFQLGSVLQMIRIQIWMKEGCAFERATEIIGLESDYPGASIMYSALASSYATMGEHEKAEENYEKAIALAGSIQTSDRFINGDVFTTRKEHLIF